MKHAFLAVIALIVISWIGSLVGLDYQVTGSFPGTHYQRPGKIAGLGETGQV
jgi:hypothetical protein